MNTERIRQTMMKHAAGPAKTDHSKLYTKPAEIPGGPAAYVRASGGANDKYSDEANTSFMRQRSDWKGKGSTAFDLSYDTRTKPSVVGWRLKAANPDGDVIKEMRIWPNQLISTRAGAWLLSPSFQQQQPVTTAVKGDASTAAKQPADKKTILLGRPDAGATEAIVNAANAGRVRFTEQPYTNEQLMRIMTLNPSNRNYLSELLAHYGRIPTDSWNKANLQPSNAAEIEAWKSAVPPLDMKQAEGNGTYYTRTGGISLSPDNVLRNYDNAWNSKANDGWWRDGVAQTGWGSPLIYSPSVAGMVSDIYGHEAGHRNMMGLAKVTEAKGAPDWNYTSRFFNPRKPVSDTNVPALMRPLDWRALMFDDQQYEWLKDHAIQTYAVNETEMNQALTGFNRGRWALKQDMINNPTNPNYKYLEEKYPGLIDKFKALPDFIPAGIAGRHQLDSIMQFFSDNPQMRTLIPEQSRLVGYYQNLKAAVDTAKTPEEKAFFQNLMDRFIYSKAFLANNQQRTVPSYQDAYQRMMA